MIVDTHAHFVPSSFLEALRTERRLFPSVKIAKEGPATRRAFAGGAPTRPVAPRLSDLKQRKEWLGAQGIDCQVAGGWLDIFGYELPDEEGADWARFMNEAMLAGAKDLPAIKPLATVPLQSGKLAARVLEEALGAEKVVLGSDHPFPIGDDTPVKVVDDTPLTAAERRMILGDTAARLFGLGSH